MHVIFMREFRGFPGCYEEHHRRILAYSSFSKALTAETWELRCFARYRPGGESCLLAMLFVQR
jgi:hypothetical protein